LQLCFFSLSHTYSTQHMLFLQLCFYQSFNCFLPILPTLLVTCHILFPTLLPLIIQASKLNWKRKYTPMVNTHIPFNFA
jgi:hypothetical protein